MENRYIQKIYNVADEIFKANSSLREIAFTSIGLSKEDKQTLIQFIENLIDISGTIFDIGKKYQEEFSVKEEAYDAAFSSANRLLKSAFVKVGDFVQQIDGDGWVAEVIDVDGDEAAISFVNGSGVDYINKDDIGFNYKKFNMAKNIDRLIRDAEEFAEEDEYDYLGSLLEIKKRLTSSANKNKYF